jgi:hypothetical protein
VGGCHRSKFLLSTVLAGRKEIVMFFWLYALIEFLALFLDSGIIPTANASYPVSGLVYPSDH